MRPRAFVVMPFGKKRIPAGSGVGKEIDFNVIWSDLLDPALRLAGCEPFREDGVTSAGDMRTDMFFELVTADLVAADILYPTITCSTNSASATVCAREAF